MQSSELKTVTIAQADNPAPEQLPWAFYDLAKEIPLTKGYVATVDAEDYEELSKRRWHVTFGGGQKCPYAARMLIVDGRRRVMRMHEFLLDIPPGFEVDHINGNSLDNRRGNLRVCTHRQNNCNRKGHRADQYGYKGLHWYKRCQCWTAQITVDGQKIHLGYFHSKLDAAAAYDKAAIKYFGEFARINGVSGAV